MSESAYLIARIYENTFRILLDYDQDFQGAQFKRIPHKVDFTLAQARDSIAILKAQLEEKGEATDLFGQERGEALESLWGNLEATLFGEAAYPTIEERAAHVLYLVVKNHPFSDGNKRIGAFLTVMYLHAQARTTLRKQLVVSDIALAAMTILVAESRPENKELVVNLIAKMLEH